MDFQYWNDSSCKGKKWVWGQEAQQTWTLVLTNQVTEFHEYCKPQLNPQFLQFCQDLTGVTQPECFMKFLISQMHGEKKF